MCLSPEPTEVVERVLEDRVALVGKEKTRGRKEGRHEGFLSAHDWGSEDLEEGEWAVQLPINSRAEFTEKVESKHAGRRVRTSQQPAGNPWLKLKLEHCADS